MRYAVFAVCVGMLCVPSYGYDMLYFRSDPDSWVGQGETREVTPADGFEFDVVSGPASLVVFIDGTVAPAEYWELIVSPLMGDTLAVGDYPTATRFNSDTTAGLDFIGNGRGNNAVTGHFEVLELEYDLGGNVTALAIDFVQYDEGDPSAGVYGSIRYNSDVEIHGVTDLSTTSTRGLAALAGIVAAMGCMAVARRRARRVV